MNLSGGVSRRQFLQQLGSGIVVLAGAQPFISPAQNPKLIYTEDFNAFLSIGINNRITVYSGKIEMGQGVMTSQAQMVADELDVALSKIDMVLGDTDLCPYDMGTFGSMTTRTFGPVLRAAAAQARTVLLRLAARQFNVRPDQLQVSDGIISVLNSPEQRVSFGALSRGERIIVAVDHKAILKTASEFRHMGTSAARLDAIEKVTGAARYAADIRLPAMLYARVLRPPAHGATLRHLDHFAVDRLRDVTLIRHNELVAVLAADPEMAQFALDQLKADWNLPAATLTPENIHQHLKEQLVDSKTLVNSGDLLRAHSTAARLFESSYTKGYVAHAALETHAALAEYKNGRLTVWASTQTPFPTRDRIAEMLDMQQKDVRVITPLLGGGFGGKSASQQAMEASRLAKLSGKPVQVAWTRAEEFFMDRFDPASVVDIISGIDGNGKIVVWDYMVYAAGERGAACLYDIPNCRVRSAGQTSYAGVPGQSNLHPFETGPWRGPGANMNVFAIESQIDIMARAAAQDPLTFRLANLNNERMHRTLRAAADAFGWSTNRRREGTGFGMACNIDAGTCVATMAEVQVDAASGKVHVERMVCAQDMGIVINPVGAKMQIEGGITMGLGYALSEELQFHGGEITDTNFHSYQIPRFSWVPKIDVVLVKNDQLAPQGCGEPAITTTGAVLANAVFDAVGARVYGLPVTPERIIRALAQKSPVARPDRKEMR